MKRKAFLMAGEVAAGGDRGNLAHQDDTIILDSLIKEFWQKQTRALSFLV